jgi:hypothetical protein
MCCICIDGALGGHKLRPLHANPRIAFWHKRWMRFAQFFCGQSTRDAAYSSDNAS